MLVNNLDDKSEGIKGQSLEKEENLAKELILGGLKRWFTGKTA